MGSGAESLPILKELFPDWSDDDLILCLEESRGELDTAITRISDGHATKFGEVTKRKDKVPKRVEHGNGRGRGRGSASGATRGRSEFRGRGRGRGASVSANGTARTAVETTPSWNETSEPVSSATEPLPAWATDDVPDTIDWSEDTKPDPIVTEDQEGQASSAPGQTPTTSHGLTGSGAAKAKSRIIDKNSTSSWASIAKPPATVKAPPPVSKVATETPLPEPTHQTIAPLTEKNLEAVTENQTYIPEPPTATVASLQGEPATGPSSLHGSVAQAAGPPGLKSGQAGTTAAVASSGRIGTPVGGRRLNQNEAVVMPGSEREPSSRLGVQFGSLGLGDDENFAERSEDNNPLQVPQQQQHAQTREEDNIQIPRQEKAQDTYAYGTYGAAQQQQQQQQPQGGFGSQRHDQFPGMSGFYGQNDHSRQSPFAGQTDYYQQQAAHGQHLSQQQYGATHSSASQRTESASRPDPSSRFGEPSNSSMTSLGTQVHHANTSPIPGHLSGHQQHSQFPMHPQYGAPNPYAYYGYGYGYPQQQQQQQQQQHQQHQPQQHQSAYAPGYNQQRGGYGSQSPYGAGPASHQAVGTSQDRFERSTAEYQRYQQGGQYSQSGFGNTDFLGSSRNQQPSEAADHYKSYNSQGSTGSREDSKPAPAGFAAPASSFGQQAPGSSHYAEQQQQPQQQPQSHAQGQYSQYGSYSGGRAGGHQQYGGGQNWNQY